MHTVDIRDGDLVVTAGYTAGRLLEAVADSGASVSVLVAGPTFDREYVGPSLRTFAAEAPNASLQVLLPQGETLSLVDDGMAAYVPSRSPDQTELVRRTMARADRVVAGFETSVPKNGTLTPGACGLFTTTVLGSADVTVAEVNPNAPRLPGLSFRADRFDHLLDAECDLPRTERPAVDATWAQVGENVAGIVPDGATVELGVGRVSEAVGAALTDHDNLGVHSGLVAPPVRDLIECGAVTRGTLVAERRDDCPLDYPILANTVLGDDQAFYDWAVDSRTVALSNMRKTTDPSLVASNPKFTAINGALQVDIQGQVNAERAGGRQLGTAGGQPAYFRAARKSSGGAGIVALPSKRANGGSNIVPSLLEDSVVTTTRLDYDCVVTEHGVARLFGEEIAGRTEALIGVAPPDERASLSHTAETFGLL
ncbi:acetyl-CoA hydrolase/transferase C-terminal domain-containing protein [Halorarius litoreus]|uniref:acetyl-CoA hydrolase/transferase C-terminal domain-containing protein n=1 Tax=Halorarius litoreus TaxID=2962676 RepID=UPI0020CBD8A5|nr:acetyl-CoA hydrolase/transferase C-terminal domain-containing protein [Halorarius litoreus]